MESYEKMADLAEHLAEHLINGNKNYVIERLLEYDMIHQITLYLMIVQILDFRYKGNSNIAEDFYNLVKNKTNLNI